MGNPNVNITNCTGRHADFELGSETLSAVLTANPQYTKASAIQMLQESEILLCTDAASLSTVTLESKVLPAGLFIQGHFTELSVASGLVRAYLA